MEEIEKIRNAQLAREIEIALPAELAREQQIAVVRAYVRDNFVAAGMCPDLPSTTKATATLTLISC